MNRDKIQAKVIDIVAEQMGIDQLEVSADTKFREELGVDSLDTVELIMECEDVFHVRINDERAEKLRTIDEATHYIAELVNALPGGE